MNEDRGIARRVLQANRAAYERKAFDEYASNPSIFEPSRQADVRLVLEEMARATGGGLLADVGSATGNIPRLAGGLFRTVVGVDLSTRLLREMAARVGGVRTVAGQAEHLPFRSAGVDAVTAYGVLHHLYDPAVLLREAARVLRPGGMLYTDHDPNRLLMRLYHPFYRWRHRDRPGFRDAVEELAEYHHTQTAGLDAEELARVARAAGFATAKVRYRLTSNPKLPGWQRLARTALEVFGGILPAPSFRTHFALLAKRGI